MSNLEFCLNFRILILLAAKSSFGDVLVEDVLILLEEAAEKISAAINERALRNGTVSQSDVRQIGTMLLKIWELARRQYVRDPITGKKWVMVMAVANASYELLSAHSKPPVQVTQLPA